MKAYIQQLSRMQYILSAIICLVWLAGCSSGNSESDEVVVVVATATSEASTNTPPPTDTPVPSTDTPVPPTDTPVPPTDTPVPPTDTPAPTPTLTLPPSEWIVGFWYSEELSEIVQYKADETFAFSVSGNSNIFVNNNGNGVVELLHPPSAGTYTFDKGRLSWRNSEEAEVCSEGSKGIVAIIDKEENKYTEITKKEDCVPGYIGMMIVRRRCIMKPILGSDRMDCEMVEAN